MIVATLSMKKTGCIATKTADMCELRRKTARNARARCLPALPARRPSRKWRRLCVKAEKSLYFAKGAQSVSCGRILKDRPKPRWTRSLVRSLKMENKLKSCPFCKSNNVSPNDFLYAIRLWSVHCLSCGAQGPDGHTKQEAIEAWNRRAGKE